MYILARVLSAIKHALFIRIFFVGENLSGINFHTEFPERIFLNYICCRKKKWKTLLIFVFIHVQGVSDFSILIIWADDLRRTYDIIKRIFLKWIWTNVLIELGIQNISATPPWPVVQISKFTKFFIPNKNFFTKIYQTQLILYYTLRFWTITL